MADDPDSVTVDDIVYAIGWHMDSQRRIYDSLLVIIKLLSLSHDQHRDIAKELTDMHAKGQFYYPPPWADDDEE